MRVEKQDIAILKSTLNAHFICRLLSDKLFEKVTTLDIVFNKLEERNSSNLEINWVKQISSKYPLNFQIVLPKFLPIDVFSLFISIKSDKTPTSGPLLNKYKDLLTEADHKVNIKEIENSLFGLLTKKINKNDKSKFEKYAVLVAIEIYKNAIRY